MTPCACHHPDPALAAEHVRRAAHLLTLVDESHHILTLRRCSCGQRWLTIFTELIDWSSGDDSQARVYAPLTDAEADDLARFTILDPARLALADLPGLAAPRRFLLMLYPRGGEKSWSWREGSVPDLPHD